MISLPGSHSRNKNKKFESKIHVGACAICGKEVWVPPIVLQLAPDINTCCRNCGEIQAGVQKGFEDDDTEDY